MDLDPTKTAVRETKRQQRLGPDAACAFCGLGALAFLIAVEDAALLTRINRRLLEQHHSLGRAQDLHLRIVLCRNCHALATDDQLRAAAPLQLQNNPLERLAASRRSRAAFDRTAADAADREANQLEELIRFLDAKLPTWRELLEKKP